MKTTEIIQVFESWAPSKLQESYDNSGLLVGDYSKEIKKVLISLDCTEEVVQEAIEQDCQMVIAHHPILFAPIKRLNGSNYVERTILKAIKNDISIYAIHTNLDNIQTGVNAMIANMLGMRNCSILQPKKQIIKKLVTYIPKPDFDTVTDALYHAGAGNIGNYSQCGFSQSGMGTFLGNELSNPRLGSKNQLERVEELRFETLFPAHLESVIVQSLLKAHPYEEVAYDIYTLDNLHQSVGAGYIGELEQGMELNDFLALLKKQFNLSVIKHTNTVQHVQKIAVCGGSGSFLRFDAIQKGADVLITSDFKYHEWFDHEQRIELIDIGHYESEQFTPQLISEYLKKNAVYLQSQISRVNSNPVNYYI